MAMAKLPLPGGMWFALVVGPILCGFGITLLWPQARSLDLSLGMVGWGAAWVLAGLLPGNGKLAAEGLGVVAVGWLFGTLGIIVARDLGPRRCRRSAIVEPIDDPRCPQCGYVLYYAQDRCCPDCGRPFQLSELDLRRARWNGDVLTPWEKASTQDPTSTTGS